MGTALLETFHDLRRPACCQFLERRDIQIAVVEVGFQRRHLPVEETTVRQMLLPQIGDLPLGTHCSRNSGSDARPPPWKSGSRTRWVSPEPPCWRVFHSSMRARTSSLWCTAMTGPSASTLSWLSVTMVAISMMTSLSGSRPVISVSIQIRFCGFCMRGSLAVRRSLAARAGAVRWRAGRVPDQQT